MEKINAKYKSNLTLEDVLSKIKFVNRMKMPFLAVNLVAYALSILTFIFVGINDPNDLYFLYIWAIFLSVIFFLEAIGFLYFGRRLVNVMPDNIRQKMKRVRILLISYGESIWLFLLTLSIVILIFILISLHLIPLLLQLTLSII